MNRTTYFLVAAGALASVVFVAACVFVFVAGAYRPPSSATATPLSSASEPTATRPPRPTAAATVPGETGTPEGTPDATSEATADSPASAGDPERGRVIFSAGQEQAPPCSGCHATTNAGRGFALGPSLWGVADRAGTRKEGMSAEAYLTESILQPRVYVVPGFRDMMYPNFADVLSATDVADIVAYLMTLHQDHPLGSE